MQCAESLYEFSLNSLNSVALSFSSLFYRLRSWLVVKAGTELGMGILKWVVGGYWGRGRKYLERLAAQLTQLSVM